MFAGVGDDPAPTIATAMAETAKSDATQAATDKQLQTAMSTSDALTIQKVAGAVMSGWGIAWMVGIYFFIYKPLMEK